MPQFDTVYTGIPLCDQANIAEYTGTQNCPTLECHWRNWVLQPTLEHGTLLGGLKQPPTPTHTHTYAHTHTQPHTEAHTVNHASLKWQDDGTTSGHISVKSASTWSLLSCNGYQFCSSNVWVLQHHTVHALDVSTIIIFVYLGLQFKWNQLSSSNSRHTSCIHKGLHAGKWPGLMTSQPDSVRLSALGYHWADYTGTTLADVISQWSSRGNPVLVCIIGTHRITTGRPLEAHWLSLILSPVAFRYTLGSAFQAHWIATGLPLNYHWLRIRDIAMVYSYSNINNSRKLSHISSILCLTVVWTILGLMTTQVLDILH